MAIRLNNIIKKPIITEKSINAAGSNVYAFEVDMSASKGLIAEQISKLFDVEVVGVKTLINPGNTRRIGKTFKFTKSGKTKKALVKIKEGQSIELFSKEQ